MEKNQRFFIYDRKEIAVLVLLGTMVAIFAFTLGVHLGKRVVPQSVTAVVEDVSTAETVADQVPNRQELSEQSKGAQQAADDTLNQSLRDEVARTGIKLDTSRQVDLPEKTKSAVGGATTLNAPSDAIANGSPAPAAAEKKLSPQELLRTLPAAVRQAPDGKFTLQVGSYPAIDEARDVVESLEALGLKPLLRPADVKGKGRYYRVFLGGYPTKEAAEIAGDRYRDQHVIDSFVISKMVE